MYEYDLIISQISLSVDRGRSHRRVSEVTVESAEHCRYETVYLIVPYQIEHKVPERSRVSIAFDHIHGYTYLYKRDFYRIQSRCSRNVTLLQENSSDHRYVWQQFAYRITAERYRVLAVVPKVRSPAARAARENAADGNRATAGQWYYRHGER